MAKQSEATLLLKIKQVGQEAFSKTGEALDTLKKFAIAAYAEISIAAGWAIKSWREQEKATNELNQVMINQGIYTKALSKEYQDMAGELQKVTTYGDEAIVSAQAQLQAYLGQTHVTKQLTKSVLDFATAQGMDLNSAAQAVGKSIGTSTNALARYGISVDSTGPKSERLAQILGQLERRFGGQAEAASKGLGGLIQMKNAIGDVGEVLGERLTGAFVFVANAIKTFAIELQRNKGLLEGFITVVHAAFNGGALLKMIFMDLSHVIGQVLGTAVVGLSQLLQGQWKMAWESFKTIPSGSMEIVSSNYEKFKQDMALMDRAFLIKKQESLKAHSDLEEQAAASRQAMAAENAAIDDANAQLRRDQEIMNTATHLDKLKNLSLTEQLKRINAMLLNENSATKQFALEERKRVIENQLNNEELKKSHEALFQFRKAKNEAELRDQETFLNTATTLSRVKSKELAAVGKAAAITQIAIATPKAVASSFAFGTSIGGPILGGVFAGIAAAAMAAQAAQVAGIPLAEGGIVRATPGGVPAVIGEGGSDEAVIPLDSPQGRALFGGGGGGTTVNFHGPVLGDPSQAREFAIVMDRELYKLRRDGNSLAFDTRLS